MKPVQTRGEASVDWYSIGDLLMPLESWNTFFNFASAILLGFTFAVGAGAVITSHFVNKRQSERLVTLETARLRQEQETAEAKRALLELQERARPRTIDADVRERLVTDLGIGPHAPVGFEFVSGRTTEPAQYAKALSEALRAGGWAVTSLDGGPALGTPATGLIIRTASNEGNARGAAMNLQALLALHGIESRLGIRPQVHADEISIMVGLKP